MNFSEENRDFDVFGNREYEVVRGGGFGFHEQRRGLIAVSGKEAAMFLNGLITNDTAKLADGAEMRAAFPNAQGRLLATVRVLKLGGKFLFATEAETYEKVLRNLQRFTLAGDFFVEDLSDAFKYFEITDAEFKAARPDTLEFQSVFGKSVFVPYDAAESFAGELKEKNAVEISDELYEILRVENGEPRYGVDADETTIVPELGIGELISYHKGCYVGQEIIARIYFRGHVAKRLTGLILEAKVEPHAELKSLEGKNAGKITSVVFSRALGKYIALAFVRYDYLAEGTNLTVADVGATVKDLPFFERK